MRADFGPVVANLGFLAVGLAILLATRFVRWSPRAVLPALGLAYLAGVAAVTLTLVALTCAGVPFTLKSIAGTMALLAAAGLAWGWRRRDKGAPVTPTATAGADRWLVAVFLALFAVFVVVGVLRAHRQLLSDWDAWAIWTPKAIGLVRSDELVLGSFASPAYAFRHPDYPMLLPFFEAIHFRAMGGVDTQAIHVQLWLLLVAAAGALAFVAARLVRPVVWVPVILSALLAPGLREQVLLGYADVPMALFLGVGTLLVGSWLAVGQRCELAVGTLCLAAAAGTKNEGAVAALLVLLVAGAVVLGSRLPDRRTPLVLALVGFVAAALPWQIWTAAHGIKGDLELGKALDPGFLIDRSGRVWPAIEALELQLADQGRWTLIVPAGLALAVLGLVLRRGRGLATFYLASALLVFASLVWAYWISPYELQWHLRTSVSRVVTVVVVITMAAALHLPAQLSRRVRPERAEPA